MKWMEQGKYEQWAQLYQENTAHKTSLNCRQTSEYDNENVTVATLLSSLLTSFYSY